MRVSSLAAKSRSANPHMYCHRKMKTQGLEKCPSAEAPAVDPLITVRTIATARILMPASRVRLSAGRQQMSREAVALCFLAGANSIFTGERLLTTPNPPANEDESMLKELGMRPMQRA